MAIHGVQCRPPLATHELFIEVNRSRGFHQTVDKMLSYHTTGTVDVLCDLIYVYYKLLATRTVCKSLQYVNGLEGNSRSSEMVLL